MIGMAEVIVALLAARIGKSEGLRLPGQRIPQSNPASVSGAASMDVAPVGGSGGFIVADPGMAGAYTSPKVSTNGGVTTVNYPYIGGTQNYTAVVNLQAAKSRAEYQARTGIDVLAQPAPAPYAEMTGTPYKRTSNLVDKVIL